MDVGDKQGQKEGPEMWNKVFTITGRVDFADYNKCLLRVGVDLLISDKPLEAMQFRDNLRLGYHRDDHHGGACLLTDTNLPSSLQ